MILGVLGAGAVAAVAGAAVATGQPQQGAMPSMPGDVPERDRLVTLPSNGPTRYRLRLVEEDVDFDDAATPAPGTPAPERRRLVVLVPGISYPMDCFDELFEQISLANRSVLVYDVTGRGFSHSSGEPMTARLFSRQLAELLDALNLSDFALNIVGWSMGTVIATTFAREHPHTVASMVLLAPPGGAAARKPLTASLLKLPFGVGAALGMRSVRRTLKKMCVCMRA